MIWDMTPRGLNEEDRDEGTSGANKKIRVCAPQDESNVESLVIGLPQDLLLLVLSRGQEREKVQSCHRQPGANPAGCDRAAASVCLMELIVFAALVLFLLLVGVLELDDATAMLLLLVGLELISAFAATPGGLAVGAAPLRCAPPAVARFARST